MFTKPLACQLGRKENVCTPLRTFIGLSSLISPLQQSQEGCVCYDPSAIQDH